MKKYIPYTYHQIDENDIAAVVETLRGGFLTTGPKIAEFEGALKEVVGAKYVTAVSSGTAALHAACFAAGITQGDEVITSAMTFAASSNCILYMGGTPVFCDICPDSWNIDPEKIEQLITPKTKAIIPVHYTGQPCDMGRINDIAKRHGLIVIEDAAHALGASLHGSPVGCLGDMAAFSFHPAKHITTGEGGAVATSSEKYYTALTSFRTHCITRDAKIFERLGEAATAGVDGGNPAPWYYEQLHLGYNYRLTDVQAALGLSQLRKLSAFISRRRDIVRMYDDAFQPLCQEGLMVLPKQIVGAASSWHIYVVRLTRQKGGSPTSCTQAPGELLACHEEKRESSPCFTSEARELFACFEPSPCFEPSACFNRNRVFGSLTSMGLGVNVHYIPVYLHPYYQKLGYKAGLCPVAEELYSSNITLPLYPSMTDDDVRYVIDSVKWVIYDR